MITLATESRPRVRLLSVLTCTLALALAQGALAQSGNSKLGAQKAIPCQACHGLDGVAKLPDAPHIAGQNVVYLVKAMRDYQTGARKDERMSIAVKGLTPDDLEDLAAFYAGLPGVGPAPR
jgi:cytochrome c553